MQITRGKSIDDSIVIGKLRFYKRPERNISEGLVADAKSELLRYEAARTRVQGELLDLYNKAADHADEETAEIFKLHALLLDKAEDLTVAVVDIISIKSCSAEYAVKKVFDEQAQVFADMSDEYFKARSADIIDVKEAVLDALLGSECAGALGDEPVILAADDLTPSELVKLDRSLILGLITEKGSSNSHTAILAKSMELPMLIQCSGIDESWDGNVAIMDGCSGCVYVDPTEEILTKMSDKQKKDIIAKDMLKDLKGKPNTTLDGRSIEVFANIGSPCEVKEVIENDAGGVGLFRSEFLYMDSMRMPGEEAQYLAYKKVLEDLSPKKVVIRTCDMGADKTTAYLGIDKEENPALGLRGIRISLTRKDFFKTQFRALLRASVHGNLAIMFPMITSVGEVTQCKEILAECRKELEKERNSKLCNIELGIMIETPAAALCAEELAREVDFFSIGTNDLTQYICAIDRQNAGLEAFFDPHHPAVLKAIAMTVEAAHKHSCKVGICGELASDHELTETFLKLGVDALSVTPRNILPLRKHIRNLDLRL